MCQCDTGVPQVCQHGTLLITSSGNRYPKKRGSFGLLRLDFQLNNKATKTRGPKSKETPQCAFLEGFHPAGEPKTAPVASSQPWLCSFAALLWISLNCGIWVHPSRTGNWARTSTQPSTTCGTALCTVASRMNWQNWFYTGSRTG